MKQYIKLGVISMVMIFLLFTVISLFIPSTVKISRAVNIYGKPDSILNYIRDTLKWRNWYPGYDTLSKTGTQISFTETQNNIISAEFTSRARKSILSSWQVIPYQQTDSVTLQWYMQFKLRWYPWEKFGSLLYEKSYGRHMEAGLNNIRQNFSN
jgi:hypothetical protein